MNLLHVSLLVTLVGMASPAIACELTRSTYRAVGNPEFQLVFASPPPNNITVYAIATLQHPKRGKFLLLHLTQSQGYGAIALFNPKSEQEVYPLYFFNQDLKQSQTEVLGKIGEAPMYAFVSGLGVSDYYRNVGRNQPFLGDVMWKLDACRK